MERKAVLTDDRHREDDEEETTETSHRSDEGSTEKSSEFVILISFRPGGLLVKCTEHESSEAFEEDHGNVETDVSRKEDFPIGGVLREVDGVAEETGRKRGKEGKKRQRRRKVNACERLRVGDRLTRQREKSNRVRILRLFHRTTKQRRPLLHQLRP